MKNLEKFTSQSFKRIVKSTPSNYSICSPNLEEQSKRQNKIITRRKKIVFSTWNNYSYCASDGNIFYHFVQFSHSVVSDSATPWTAAHKASLSITNSWSLCKLMCIVLVMPSNQLILCRPLLLLPSIFPSIGVVSNESALCVRWPKYWRFSFNISPSNEHPGLISFRVDWLDLLADQGTLKSLLQHHSSKASILRCSAFFIVQSHIHTWPLEKP